MKCHLVAFLGPRGLTRMALRFQEPSSASCAMELTSACNVHQDVQEMKDGRPDVETQHICWGSNSLFTWRSLMTGCSSMIFSLQPRKLLIHDLFTFRRFVGIVAHAVYMCMYIYIYICGVLVCAVLWWMCRFWLSFSVISFDPLDFEGPPGICGIRIGHWTLLCWVCRRKAWLYCDRRICGVSSGVSYHKLRTVSLAPKGTQIKESDAKWWPCREWDGQIPAHCAYFHYLFEVCT